MFFPSDYAIIKSQEMRMHELVLEAQNDRLADAARPPRRGFLQQCAQAALRGIGRIMVTIGKSLERPDTGELVLTRQGTPH